MEQVRSLTIPDCEAVLRQVLGSEKAERMIGHAGLIPVERKRVEWLQSLVKTLATADTFPLKVVSQWKWEPVDVRTFIEDSYFLGKRGTVFPSVMDELQEINNGKYYEVVFTGGIGSGKTTAALYTQAYQLYLLSCMRDPHFAYDLDASTEIMLIFQSIRKELAERVEFRRFRDMVSKSPYFLEQFPFRQDLSSKLMFENRIEVIPVSGLETAAIGQNVMGGIIDELNYMSVIEKSKGSVDGGKFDQAVSLYNSISRRRQSRFMQRGGMPGILCLVSSRRYPGQFTDRKEEEAKNDPGIYVYDKCTWDVRPDAFCGDRFAVFTGDEFRKPRVLEEEAELARALELDPGLVKMVPVEYREEFRVDIVNALREIAGVSTLATHPFILNTDAISACMTRSSVFTDDATDFVDRLVKILPKHIERPDVPRFVHVDLGLTSDSAGIALGHVKGFRHVERGDATEHLPEYVIDGVLSVDPPKGGEIQFWKIRNILYRLRELGMNVRWVTYDSYQSVDSMQLLHQQGFSVGNQSMDTDRRPYEVLKTAIYDQRVEMPSHPKLRRELASLEDDPERGRIDHPPNGSKDCSDAVAGVVYGLLMRMDTWHRYNVPTSRIPPSVRELMDRAKMSGLPVGEKG